MQSCLFTTSFINIKIGGWSPSILIIAYGRSCLLELEFINERMSFGIALLELHINSSRKYVIICDCTLHFLWQPAAVPPSFIYYCG